ncbi:MAG: SPOR domain-containing protein [Candidatus Dechloromonas phosphoritropha]|jgi:cell division protein FtsN|nr:SPOR domain-containing protein [Candidatus Dechloromonas phosphoritropha]MBP8787476.1 SPOR domain-containing protein [Azonexus sp.]MBP9229119.1 SPOR domain-containing protein [Azonexus sp.]
MSRDLKPKKNQPARKKARGGTLIGMFIGLVIGVVIAAGVVWTMNKSPLPFNKQVMTQTPPPEGGKVNGVKAVAPAGDAQPPLPITLPGKPGDPIPEKRFQFYDILPGKSNAVPDKAPKPVAREEPKKEEKKEEAKVESKESKTPLFLQAGSFSTPHDADNQKAKLAFMGVEAVVQQVMVQDKTYYRVRVGPYTKSDELNKVRAELARDGIEAQVVKSKE